MDEERGGEGERLRCSIGLKWTVTRQEIEAGDSRGSIYIAPAFRAGLGAETGKKVGVLVVGDVEVCRDPDDIEFDLRRNGGNEELEGVEERGGGSSAHLVAFGEDTEGELAVREDIQIVDVGGGGNAGKGELDAHSDGPELADIVGAVSEGGEGFRRPGRAVFGVEVCPGSAGAGVGIGGAVGEADDGGRRGLGHQILEGRVGEGAASLSW